VRKVLYFAAATEIATGIGFIVAPTIVLPLLVRGEINDLVLLLARVLGITLIALGLAAWPGRQGADGELAGRRGLLTYNALVALFLTYVGAALNLGGPLVWPTVALHGVVALLLIGIAGFSWREA
jgi:hypothetical protein